MTILKYQIDIQKLKAFIPSEFAKAIRNQKEPQPRKSVHIYAGSSTNHLFGHFYNSQ